MVLFTPFLLPKKNEDSRSVIKMATDNTFLILEKVERARKLRQLEKEIQRDKESYLRLKQELLNKKRKEPNGRGLQTSPPNRAVEVNDIKAGNGKKRKAGEAFKQLHVSPEKFLKLDALIARAVQESKEAGDLIHEIDEFLGECQKLLGHCAFADTKQLLTDDKCERDQTTSLAGLRMDTIIVNTAMPIVVDGSLNANNNCRNESALPCTAETQTIKFSFKPAPILCNPSIQPKKKKFRFVPVSFP